MKKMFTKAFLVDLLQRMVRQRFGTFVTLSKITKWEELQFDKYDVLYVVMAAEEICQIEITPEEMSTINTFGDLVNVAAAKLKNECRLEDVRQNVKSEAKTENPAPKADKCNCENCTCDNEEEKPVDDAPAEEPKGDAPIQVEDEEVPVEPEKSVEEQQKEFAKSQMDEEGEPEKEKTLTGQQAEYAKEQMAAEAKGESPVEEATAPAEEPKAEQAN